jgi:hypothetical protein
VGATNALALPFPELTETADGPDAFSDLANAVEDYVYDRILPAGVTRYLSHHWGQGTSVPATSTTGLRQGDTYFHTGLSAMLKYNGTAWRVIGISNSSSVDAPLYDGQYRDHPTYGLERSIGGVWTNPNPPVAALLVGAAGTTALPNNTWTAIPMAGTEEIDTHNGHSTTTNPSRWTCPSGEGGVYWVVGNTRIDNGTGKRSCGVRRNGTEIFRLNQTVGTPAASGYVIGSTPGLIQLDPGDYVETWALQESGGALTANNAFSSLTVLRAYRT